MRPEVKASCGRLRGREQDGILAFRGILYAQPPVGEQRFGPPMHPVSWPGVRDVGEAAGPVESGGPVADGRLAEDCLYLNVYTPGADSAQRPVLVWIDSSDFTGGSASQDICDGSVLARRGDVVVVTIRYRLGALGFLYLDELGDDLLGAVANAGLLDQVAALEWVRDNIAAFGGDPKNMTAFGTSTGATSIAALLGAPRARGLFHKAILQSAGPHELHVRWDATRIAAEFLTELGRMPREIPALWKMEADELLRAQQTLVERLNATRGESLFRPVLDDRVILQTPLAAIREGRARDIPLLIGTNLDECRSDPERAQRLDERMLLARVAEIAPGTDAEGLVAAYARERGERSSASFSALLGAIETDARFRLPAIRMAEAYAMHQPQTYLYLFAWDPPRSGAVIGDGHGREVPFVFGNLDATRAEGSPAVTPEAERLSTQMMDAWLAFARTGDPGHQNLEHWPAYEPTSRATMVLERDCRVSRVPEDPLRRAWETRRAPGPKARGPRHPQTPRA